MLARAEAETAKSLVERCFCNIGAGAFEHRFWTNVDLASDWYSCAQEADFINFDLEALEQLPVAAESAELVYSSALNFFTSKCSLGFHRRYPGNHINWWSAGKMAMMLEEAGFDTVYRSGYGQSAAPPLRNLGHFDRTHPRISLYMEAVKS